MRNDGPTFVYEEMHTKPGAHKIDIRIKDSKEINPLDYRFEKDIEIKPQEAAVIDLTNMF